MNPMAAVLTVQMAEAVGVGFLHELKIQILSCHLPAYDPPWTCCHLCKMSKLLS